MLIRTACKSCLGGLRNRSRSSRIQMRFKSEVRDKPSNYRRPNYSGFYTSIMDQKAPERQVEDANSAEKPGVVFYSRLAGYPENRPSETESKMYCGVIVPPRPEEPLNCCQSGCVHCVWDIYREEIEDYQEKRKQAREALAKERKAIPVELGGDGKEPDDILAQLDPTLQAFIKLEKELKEKRLKKQAQRASKDLR
ncbi:oxidoreductase-like protein [Protomyces lactucae-debilis]|uniref:Oxidoreductase-like protein n=1 Tax=Protomyces lactucae-debilis TaxID=2754530 RepID=A0A1Y2FBW8_PROLT|nr:oxidoreductase-like protein [Protomyces lactucae-debilis]ORY81419.1 oxidoreductase-like protein [Protomyces lactucae-debilis]